MSMDDRPGGSQPPQNQPPPQQGYQPQQQQPQQQPPPQQRQGPNMPNMPSMGNMADMGKGNPYLMNPDVRLNSIERMTVMLIRLAAWIALLVLAIRLCGDFIRIFTAPGSSGTAINVSGLGVSSGSITFNSLLTDSVNFLGTFAAGALAAVTLLGLASIVESLVAMRNNKS